MNRRAARRHAATTPSAKGGRPNARAVAKQRGKSAQRVSVGRSFRGRLYPEWSRNIISELRKVVWPTREETKNLTIVVIVVAISVGVVLGLLDFLFSWLADRILF